MAAATSAALLSTAARRLSRSASSIVTRELTGHHNLTIEGFAPSRKFPADWTASTPAFDAAGHGWRITYRPNGNSWPEYVSLHLEPVDGGGRRQVAATDPVEVSFTLLDPAGNPRYTRSLPGVSYFDGDEMSKGFQKFIHWSDLEKSGCLEDDTFTVRCDITVIKNWTENANGGGTAADADPAARVVVPPSDLHRDLSNLLCKKHGKDVLIDVGGEATYEAHGWLLVARSPVLEAELLAAAKEKVPAVRRRMEVKGMEPKVFEALLRFVYTDALPEVEEGDRADDAIAMARALLAAARRYKLERLGLLCEEALCERVDMDTVAGNIVAAEEHGCRALRAACVEFLNRPGNLKAVMETEEYEKIKASCPSMMMELLLKHMAARLT
jgi:speckle-type POZ protein